MASGRQQEGVPVQEIYGYFLVRQQEDHDDKDEEDSDDDDEFMDLGDYNIYSSGSVLVDAKPLKVELVSFKEYKTGKVYNIQGRFPMIDPWWSARIQVRKTKQSKKYLMGYPQYEIRSDHAVHDVMATFMKACDIHPQHYGIFLTKLDQMKLKQGLNFHNLKERIRDFEQGGGEVHVAITIREQTKTGVGELIELCTEGGYSEFFKYMPQLLPKHFYGILLYKPDKVDEWSNGEEDQEEKKKKRDKKLKEHAIMRDKINALVKEDPWVFGFACIVQQRSGLSGCEAPIERFYSSELMNNITGVENHALHVYDGLKDTCRQDGHTYIPYEHLKETNPETNDRCKRFDKYEFKLRIKQWKPVLDFLENHNVIKRETIHGSLRVYLTKFWKAETTIADCMKELLEKDGECPWKFDVDFESQQFKGLRDDPYQQEAATMISQHPVVCINGKGGCGKTTVVSAAFKHLESLLESEKKSEDDWNDSQEDDLLTQISEAAEMTYFSQTPTKANPDTSCDISFLSPSSNKDTPDKFCFDVDDESFNLLETSCGGPVELPDKDITSFENNNEPQDQKTQTGDQKEEIKNLKEPIILLTAPTGKAANLIGDRAKLPSFTIHSVVMSYWNWKKGKNVDKDGKPLEWRFRKVVALVVDECSLVSVCIFSNLLKALMDEGQLKKLVLLGDVHQLPSIDPGNFLNDVFTSLLKMGLSVLLLKNHRSDAELIVANANRIQQKKLPEIDPAKNFYQFNIQDDFDRDKVIKALLTRKNPDLEGDRTSQFVAFRNVDCDAINEMCCWFYANHGIKKSNKKRHFEVDDKICCTKNATVADYSSPITKKRVKPKETDSTCHPSEDSNTTDNPFAGSQQKPPGVEDSAAEEEEETIDGHKTIKLCNGEIFFIKQKIEEVANDGRKTEFLVLETDDKKKQFKVDFRHLKQSCKLRHAWARTIHTYQGSESATVIYVVGSPVNQTWQHVYTAVTRGKTQVVIVTKPENLIKAVSKSPWRRRTSLRERLERIDTKLWPSHKSADTSQLSETKPDQSQSVEPLSAGQSQSGRANVGPQGQREPLSAGQSQAGRAKGGPKGQREPLSAGQSQSGRANVRPKGQSSIKSYLSDAVSVGVASSKPPQKAPNFLQGATNIDPGHHSRLTETHWNSGGEDCPTTDSQASANSSMWSDFGEEEQEFVAEMEATFIQTQPAFIENTAGHKVKKNLFSSPSSKVQKSVYIESVLTHQECSLSEDNDDDELDLSSQSLLEDILTKKYISASPKRSLVLADHIEEKQCKRSKADSLPVTDSFESPVRRTLEGFSLNR